MNPNTPVILRNYLDAWNAHQAQEVEVLLAVGTLVDRLRECAAAGESLLPALAIQFCDQLDALQLLAMNGVGQQDDAVTDLLHGLQYVGEMLQAPAEAKADAVDVATPATGAGQAQEDDVGGLSDVARRACWDTSDAVELYMREAISNVPMLQAEYCGDTPGLIAVYVQSCATVHAANVQALNRAAYCRCSGSRAQPHQAPAAARGIQPRRDNASGHTA